MAFAIFRIDKKSSVAQIQRTANHHLRTQPVSNADPERTIEILAGPESAADVVDIIKGATDPLAKRKDAVRCFDALMTASPEFFKEGGSVDAFKQRAMDWAADTFGGDNIVSAVMHLDETTPHIQLLVTPIHNGKLQAKEWTGSPAKLRALQDSFAKAMKPLGLERGVKYSNAEHKDIATWYGELEPKMAEAKRVIEQAPVIEQQLEEERRKVKAEKTKVLNNSFKLDFAEMAQDKREKELNALEKSLHQERSQLEKVRAELTELKQLMYQQFKAIREVFSQLPDYARAKANELLEAYKELPPPVAIPPATRPDPVSAPDPVPQPAPAPKPK